MGNGWFWLLLLSSSFEISNLFGGDLGKGRGNLEFSGGVVGIGAVDLN